MGSMYFIFFNQFSIFLYMLIITYFTGQILERMHFRSIHEREKQYAHIITCNLKTLPLPGKQTNAHLVDGQITVAADYFKGVMAYFRKIFGGRLRSFETLLNRARREALLRLLEQADAAGATHVLNVRYETSRIYSGRRNRGFFCAEVYAYGTAVTIEDTP